MSGTQTSAEKELKPNGAAERRFYPRVAPSAFIYVAIGETVGKLLDMSENGLLISAQSEVARDTVSRVSIGLNGVAKPIEVTVRVVWTTESKKRGGIQFLDLSEDDREQIRKWQAQENHPRRNTEHATSQASVERVVGEKSELLPVAAGLTEANFGRDLTVEKLGRNRTVEGMERAAEPIADSSYTPSFATIGARPDARVKSDSGEHRGVQRFGVDKTWRQLALVVGVALLAGLVFAIGTSFSQASHKSQNLSGDVRTQNNVITPTAEGHALKQIDATEMPANITQPESVPDLEGTSVMESGAAKSHKFSNIRQEEVVGSAKSSDSVSDFKYRAVREDRNSPRQTASQFSSTGAAQTDYTNGKTTGTADFQTPSIGASLEKSAIIHSISNTERTDETTSSTRPAGIRTDPAFPSAYPPSSAPSTSAPATFVASTSAPTSSARLSTPTTIAPMETVRTTTTSTTTASRVAPGGREPDTPESRVTLVAIPKGNASPILKIPGERVLETAGASIRIQRSVFVPDEKKWWWPVHRSKNKEVLLGELVAHADPQTTRLRMREGDTVRVRAFVDKDGNVVNLKPISGPVELMPAVMRAVREWRYQPTYIDATRVETEAYISIEFRPATGRASK